MGLIILKPTSPSKRHYFNINNNLNKKFVIKSLIIKNINPGGRNNTGKITIRHKGSLNKRLYRIISFCNKVNFIGVIFSIEYDPYRTSNIASVYDIQNKSFFYILAPQKLRIGNIIKTSSNIEKNRKLYDIESSSIRMPDLQYFVKM